MGEATPGTGKGTGEGARPETAPDAGPDTGPQTGHRTGPLPGPVAYLTGEYFQVSHAWMHREVRALRRHGVDLRLCTIRTSGEAEFRRFGYGDEADGVFRLLERARRPLTLIGAHLRLLRRRPRAWAAALRLAWRTRAPGTRAALYQLFYFAEAGVLAEHLHRSGVAHLHNHFANSSCSVAMLASRLSGIPYSLTMHGPAIFFEPERWRIDVKIARAAFTACISHFCRSQGMAFAPPEHWERMHIVHCGVEPARYGGGAAPDAEQPRLLFVGRLAAVKGLPVLFEALARLRARFPGVTLDLIGDGAGRASLEARAAALGLGEAVRFLGYRSPEEVAERLGAADVFVLPSFAEGVPVVLMEAMAARRPVIATRIAGIGELVEEGVGGYLVPPGDAETLAERLERLIADPGLRRRMGEAGRARVAAEFDVDIEAARLLALFRAAMAAEPPPALRPEPPGRAQDAVAPAAAAGA